MADEKDDSPKKAKSPSWGYKKTGSGFDSKLFADDVLPKGWKDTPAGMTDD